MLIAMARRLGRNDDEVLLLIMNALHTLTMEEALEALVRRERPRGPAPLVPAPHCAL